MIKSVKSNINKNKGLLNSLSEKLDNLDKRLDREIEEKKASQSKAQKIIGYVIFYISLIYLFIGIIALILFKGLGI